MQSVNMKQHGDKKSLEEYDKGRVHRLASHKMIQRKMILCRQAEQLIAIEISL